MENVERNKDEQNTHMTDTAYCKKCGTMIPEAAVVCPKCGELQVDINSWKQEKRKKRLAVEGIVVVSLIVLIFFLRYVTDVHEKKKYKENYETIYNVMADKAGEAEDVCVLIHDVWYNSIFEVDDVTTDNYTKSSYGWFNDDFNESLNNLMTDSKYTDKANDLKSSKTKIDSMMSDMSNPPNEYKEAYYALYDFYTAYCDMIDLAVNPSGSLTDYTDSYRKKDDELAETYKKASRYLND